MICRRTFWAAWEARWAAFGYSPWSSAALMLFALLWAPVAVLAVVFPEGRWSLVSDLMLGCLGVCAVEVALATLRRVGR